MSSISAEIMEKWLLRHINKYPYKSTVVTELKNTPQKVKTLSNYLQLKYIIPSSGHSLLFYVEDKNRFATQSSR